MYPDNLLQPVIPPIDLQLSQASYLEIVEKTNQQLSLWYNPYGVMVGVLSLTVGLLAIGATFLVYKLSSDSKKQLQEEKDEHQRQLDEFKRATSSALEVAMEARLQLVQEEGNKQIEALKKNASKLAIGQTGDLERQIHELQEILEKQETTSATVPPGSLISAESLSFLFWYGKDCKRYAIQTDDVFHSWFPSVRFRPLIRSLSDAQVAAIPLAGNITYRAGTRLIKIASDTKIYAVARNGVIHWIPREETIVQIFGSDWQRLLVTVYDVLFVDYTVGYSINSPADFNPTEEERLHELP